jgi:hypothetical protein
MQLLDELEVGPNIDQIVLPEPLVLKNDPGTANRNRLQTAKAQLLRTPTIIE